VTDAQRIHRQFGLWESWISPASAASALRLSSPQWDANGGLVWREERSGHGVLVYQEPGGDAPRDLTDALAVRARVGYGGGDFAVAGGAVYFIEGESGRIFRQPVTGGVAAPITPGFGNAASPAISPDNRWVVYVHTDEGKDRLAIVDSDGRHWPRIAAAGSDFYMQPCWNPEGTMIAWVEWDHPWMPWDGTRLMVATLVPAEDEPVPRFHAPKQLAGGDETAIFQPCFTSDGRSIVYISDETGWGSLHVRKLAGGEAHLIAAEQAEMGEPGWIQGQRTYALSPDGRRAYVTVNRDGFVTAMAADLESGDLRPISALDRYSDILDPAVDPLTGRLAAIGSSPSIPPRVLCVEDWERPARILRRSAAENESPEAFSTPEAITWSSLDGELVHGLYYPPASDRFVGGAKPPLVVLVHGGPTSQTKAAYAVTAQFLATRGYAVLAVNYRGSTGYGREYTLALRRRWGVLDVEDSISGARALAERGRVDGARTAVMGGSAGGYTVLQSMIDYPDAFAAGVCMFGVSNQFTLAAETHKFESRYTESLIGPLPEAAALYRERSPELRASAIRRPLAVFQGEIDEVVPKNQSDAIVAALERSGTAHEYHVYPGEGHGWRKRETIVEFYNALERFLKRYLVYA
jgi:dipeptidyl aminopeptidase/acylaminoacyl peptidase